MTMDNGRLAECVVDVHNVKTQRTFFDMTLAKEVMRGTNQGFVFFLGDAQFGKREFAFHREASANFDEREGISVEADEVKFAFGNAPAYRFGQ
jgi:hypothetical protein